MKAGTITLGLLAAAMAMTSACTLQVTAKDDSLVSNSAEAALSIFIGENDNIESPAFGILSGGTHYTTAILEQPACGSVKIVDLQNLKENQPMILAEYDRSAGALAGTYRFKYILYATAGFLTKSDDASGMVTFTQDYAAPDGSETCGAPYQAFINSASAGGGAAAVSWIVPEGIEFADSYRLTVLNQDPASGGSAIGSLAVSVPGGHGAQSSSVAYTGSPSVLGITLDTIKGGKVVFTDTLMGVQGATQDFILVDDYVQLIKDVTDSATVDVLANDQLTQPSATARIKWARLDGAAVSIVNDGGMNASVTGDGLVSVNGVGKTAPRQYVIALETTMAGANPQRQYLFVDYIAVDQTPPTINDDSFSGYANENVGLDVLANDSAADGGPLTIVSFTQPGGATVTSSGSALTINGPAGSHYFGYNAADSHGNKGSASVSVQLTNRPDSQPAPVLCDIFGNPPGCIKQCPNPAMLWPNCA
ncbi:MAG: Ig-like domain-containing protein [Nitrospinota bacterium]|nr:Ig-like domain-containing protein [Nitrospinota bacterium]